ncbi:MAG TPA: HAD family hydrolase [Azoarcus taiwanensis]|nr:HAD family hydrolase [Azoarcus taiwanensis]
MVVLADADNTLWDTDAVFREAQLLLLSQVEAARGVSCPEYDRLGYVRAYDQALAQSHHLHLRYPPQLLVRCLEAGLGGIPAQAAAKDAITGRRLVSKPLDEAGVMVIVADYLAALSQTPALLPGVAEGLRAAKTAGLRLYVMTEGRIEKQKRILELHNLQTFFEGVWALTKDRAQFDRVRTRFNSCHVVIIGDQPDRDIAPAKAAGCSTVLIPSRFKPSWHSPDDYGAADYVAADFNDAIQWCAKAAAEGPLSR